MGCMSRSWKIAVSQRHERGEGAGGAGPGDAALQEKKKKKGLLRVALLPPRPCPLQA